MNDEHIVTGQPRIAAPLKSAMFSAFVQQVIILLLAGTILDGGVIAQMCLFACAVFWGGVAVILLRRRLTPTNLDLTLVRVGSLLVCFISYVVSVSIWHWKGY